MLRFKMNYSKPLPNFKMRPLSKQFVLELQHEADPCILNEALIKLKKFRDPHLDMGLGWGDVNSNC